VIVIKFGGTSVGDAAAIERAAEIVRGRLDRRPVVVVSALAGTTNLLLRVAGQAAQGHLIGALRAVETIRERHLREAEALLGGGPEADEVHSDLSAMCDELAGLAEALSVLGHHTPRSEDTVAAYGEQMSSHLVVAAFRARGLPAELIDARRVMITDEQFTRAAPNHAAIERAAGEHLRPVVDAGRLPVMGGYIGATAKGVTTTLGRGGSDYTAALVGAALGAEAIEIWTDVDGMLTADPRVVPGARTIERIRFDEAAELAAFGAKVLHPATIAPAVARGIPVCIFNSFRPGGAGTRITAEAPLRGVSAIAGRAPVTVVKVRSSRMLLARGFLRALFEVFERHHTSVDVVATSEVSVSATVDDPAHVDAIVADLAPLGEVTVERDRALLAVVGAALGGDSATMARALGALGGTRVHMISLAASDINFTLVLDAADLEPAMRALHEAFFT
jgi:aspartate kinase